MLTYGMREYAQTFFIVTVNQQTPSLLLTKPPPTEITLTALTHQQVDRLFIAERIN